MKGFGILHWSGVTPHVVLVRRRSRSPAVALAMSMGWHNTETVRDSVEVCDDPKNPKRGTVLEVNLLILPFAFGTLWQFAKALLVACFTHTASDECAGSKSTCAFYSVSTLLIEDFSAP